MRVRAVLASAERALADGVSMPATDAISIAWRQGHGMSGEHIILSPRGAKALLVCSTGGHLSELLRLEARVEANPDSLWVTFDTPQSRELLAGRRVHYLPYVGPRDLKGTAAAVPGLRRIVRAEDFDVALSTGAAIATAALPVAAFARIPATYIESVCRVQGPSATGRILERVPAVRLRTPYAWDRHPWRSAPSVLSDFMSVPAPVERRPQRLFVTLGTIQGYRFDSVVDAVLASGLAGPETVWQLGFTERSDALPGTVRDYLPPNEFSDAAREADVVVTHAGVGTLLELLSLGVYPVQAVRRAHRKEHVDDHQTQIAALVNDLDIGTAVDGPDVTAEVIEHAATRRIADRMKESVTS